MSLVNESRCYFVTHSHLIWLIYLRDVTHSHWTWLVDICQKASIWDKTHARMAWLIHTWRRWRSDHQQQYWYNTNTH